MRARIPVVMLGLFIAFQPMASAEASETCTIAYDLDATVQVTDSILGIGDETISGLRGSLVLEYTEDDRGHVTDGPVRMLHYWTFEKLRMGNLITVSTTVHLFAPRCNGIESPAWRSPEDETFPSSCRYDGKAAPVAFGTLSLEKNVVEWAQCGAAEDYGAEDRDAYTPSDESTGRGCLTDLHAVGMVRCDGRLACKMGGLEPGDNPQRYVWTQPMIVPGRPGSGFLEISDDLATIRTPLASEGAYQSYNLPNHSPSRSWLSWRGTRDRASEHTTCAK